MSTRRFQKNYIPSPPPSRIYSRYASLLEHLKINVIYCINKLKKKIMPISSEKTFGKIEYLFIIKNAQQVRNRGQWPELDKEAFI